MVREKYKYKIAIRYIDTIDIFIEKDENRLFLIGQALNSNSSEFLSIGNKLVNKKDIIFIEKIETVEA